MTVRRLIFWLHLAVGLSVGLVVAFLALTGSLLAFQSQITAWSERDLRIAHVAPAETCIAPSQLLANAASSAHRAPTSLRVFADRHRPAEVTFGRDLVLLVNPCSGAVVSTDAGRLRAFFLDVTDLHRWVALQGVRHETLRSLKNVAVAALLLMLISGLIIWVPRQLSWKHLKPTVLLNLGKRGRAREWNLHNVFGIWSLIPLLVIVGTGLIMAYPWANDLLYRASGTPAPPSRPVAERKTGKPLDPAKYAKLDPAIDRAITQDAQWASVLIRVPAEKETTVSFTLDEGSGGRPQQRAQLSLDLQTLQVLKWEPFAAATRGRQWRMYARYLHTGELLGLTGQIVALLACLSLLVLVGTGFLLSVRRASAWRRRRVLAATRSKLQEVSA